MYTAFNRVGETLAIERINSLDYARLKVQFNTDIGRRIFQNILRSDQHQES